MKARSLIALVLLIIPIILVLLWHLSNHALPTDDAANHAETSLRIAKQFNQHGFFGGMAALLNTRGWRPIVFPPLAVPFLLLTGNDVIAACAASLLLIYAALMLYLYRLVRLWTEDPLIAAATTVAVLSMPVIASYALTFFSELAWLLFSVACLDHLLRSGPFKEPAQAAVAGFFGGLMIAVRPVESVVVLTVLLTFLAVPAIQSKALVLRSSLIVLGLFSMPALLLFLSAWVKGITRLEIWAACVVAVTAGVFLARRYGPSFVAFFAALTSVSCIWWAGFMPALLGWAHGVWGYSGTAQVSGMRSLGQITQTLLRQARDYGEVQLATLAGLAIYLIVSAILKVRRNRGPSDSRAAINTPVWLVLYASSILLVISAALYATGGSDRRRGLVALALFAASVIAIAGSRTRLALAAMFCLIGVQLMVFGNAIAGAPVWGTHNGFGIPIPHRGPDGNIDIARGLSRYISPGSAVAVYTLALYRLDARIYEPNALKLACLQMNCGFEVGYFWDAGQYDDVVTRLRQANFKYLLLDSFSEFAPTATHEPYVHFAVEMLRRMRAGGTDTPGLQVIARFQIGGRDQTLFRVLGNEPTVIATEQQEGFPIVNLNDGTAAAWGSLEGKNDVYAAIVLPSPRAIKEVRLRLFSPAGRPHLRDIRIVTADGEGPNGPLWQFVRARLKGSGLFASVITVPPLPDNSMVTIEIDHQDPHWRSRPIWGFACLRSQGDLPNYLTIGTGVYVRELKIQ